MSPKTLIERYGVFMRLSAELAFKNLSECLPGELVRLPYASSSALAIVLAPTNAARLPTLGFLSAPETAPYQKIAEEAGDVLSYGNDWVIRPVVDEMSINYSSEDIQSGAIVIAREGPAFVFKGSHIRERHTVRLFLLDGGREIHDEEHYRLPRINRWTIFQTPNDMMIPGQSPLTHFEVSRVE